MHDPLTVAFEIRSPFRGKPDEIWPKGRRDTIVTIWHKDPWRGCEDSCDWFGSNRGDHKAIEKQARSMLSWSKTQHDVRFFDHPRFDRTVDLPVNMDGRDGPKYAATFGEIGFGDAYALTLYAIHIIAWQMDRRELKGRLFQWAIGFALKHDNARIWAVETDEEKLGAFKSLIREYQRFKRPWWRHPRWHVWHWRIQIHPLQSLWHWIFDRCSHCGGRFRWKEGKVGNWNGDQVAHFSCAGVTAKESGPEVANG